MLQINVQPYASDALEDAMRLAQTKALNSYSFSDCLNYLNYAWMDIYQKVAQQDEGYYSRTVQLTQRLTKLPPHVKNSVRIYAAQHPVGFNRDIFRASGYNDLEGINTYHISGFDLYCPDAERRTVWLNYVPMQAQIFFTRNNRDPKLFDEDVATVKNKLYNLYILKTFSAISPDIEIDFSNSETTQEQMIAIGSYILVHRNINIDESADITDTLKFMGDDWDIVYITCDFPYMFVTYKHKVTGECYSGFFRDVINNSEFIEYNPFAFEGRNSNVEYIQCKWNDKTGLGVIIIDHNDQDRIKELGWTPDTLLTYPAPEMYRLLVARLADKFAAFNEGASMGVQKELVEANYAFVNFLKKDKSAWQRIDNVNGPTIGDLL